MRKVEYIGNGGKPLSVAPADIVACVMRHTSLDPRYFLGTAQHETSFAANEVDTEDSGYVSSGLWQLGVEEATSVGMHDADLLDLEESTIVFCKVTEKRMSTIFQMVQASLAARWPTQSGLNAYLMIAHNQGLAACLKTIKLHGLDWAGYKMRNLQAAQMEVDTATGLGTASQRYKDAVIKLAWWKNVAAYGDDCISGGARWSDLLLGPAPNV